jgi:hypothetical protein
MLKRILANLLGVLFMIFIGVVAGILAFLWGIVVETLIFKYSGEMFEDYGKWLAIATFIMITPALIVNYFINSTRLVGVSIKYLVIFPINLFILSLVQGLDEWGIMIGRSGLESVIIIATLAATIAVILSWIASPKEREST